MSDATSMIDFEKMTVSSAFKGKHYVVPAYQREFVWKYDGAVEQFITDIWEAFLTAPDKSYFIGSMVTYKHGEDELELIDGQQRMTTLFVLLCVLYHIYQTNNSESSTIEQLICSTRMDENGDDIQELSMQLQYEETNDVLDNIWANRIPSDEDLDALSPSSMKLYKAYEALLKYVSNATSDFAEVKRFVAYLLQRVLFIQITTRDIADALKIFETINERGEGLNPLDLLKNMIFSNVPRSEFDNLNTQWKTMIDQINAVGEKPLRFLRYFLTANYNVSEKEKYGILPEDRIYKWINEHDDQCHYKNSPFAFVGAMNDSVHKYSMYLYPADDTNGNVYLKDIPLIAGKQSRLHMVLLLATGQMNSETRIKFIKILELLAYYAAVNKIKSNRIEPLYAEWCEKVRAIKTDDDLKDFVIKEVVHQLDKWKANYYQNFMALNWDSLQQYRLKYILARMTKYVDEKNAGRSDFAYVEKYLDSDVQIEHIMPKDSTDYASYGMSLDEYQIYLRRLGNLTLLEKTINTSIKAKPYKEKCKKYPNSNYYLTASLPKVKKIGVNTAQDKMNRQLQQWAGISTDSETMWTKWNKKTIDARQELLYHLSEEVWNLDEIINTL